MMDRLMYWVQCIVITLGLAVYSVGAITPAVAETLNDSNAVQQDCSPPPSWITLNPDVTADDIMVEEPCTDKHVPAASIGDGDNSERVQFSADITTDDILTHPSAAVSQETECSRTLSIQLQQDITTSDLLLLIQDSVRAKRRVIDVDPERWQLTLELPRYRCARALSHAELDYSHYRGVVSVIGIRE